MKIPQSPPNPAGVLEDPNKLVSLIQQALHDESIRAFVRQANERCLHWNKFRYHPVPAGVTREEAWFLVASQREGTELPVSFTPLKQRLRLFQTSRHAQWLHELDKDSAGTICGVDIPDDDERYLYNALMEEAIASSQLEG